MLFRIEYESNGVKTRTIVQCDGDSTDCARMFARCCPNAYLVSVEPTGESDARNLGNDLYGEARNGTPLTVAYETPRSWLLNNTDGEE